MVTGGIFDVMDNTSGVFYVMDNTSGVFYVMDTSEVLDRKPEPFFQTGLRLPWLLVVGVKSEGRCCHPVVMSLRLVCLFAS